MNIIIRLNKGEEREVAKYVTGIIDQDMRLKGQATSALSVKTIVTTLSA
jgi:hypothetical protein